MGLHSTGDKRDVVWGRAGDTWRQPVDNDERFAEGNTELSTCDFSAFAGGGRVSDRYEKR